MNTRRKGRRNELKAKEILECLGFEVQLAPNPTRYSKQNDLFGRWDLIASSKLQIRFVQVKSNKPPYGKRRKHYASFPCPNTPEVSKEIWVFYDRVKEPEIIQI